MIQNPIFYRYICSYEIDNKTLKTNRKYEKS